MATHRKKSTPPKKRRKRARDGTFRGGARPGAGRKVAAPEGPVVRVTLSIPAGLIERVDARAKRDGSNRSAVVSEALRKI